MGERTIHEGCARRWILLAASYDACLPLAAPAFDDRSHDGGRLHPARREGYADDVGNPPSGVPENAPFAPALTYPCREPADLVQQGLRRHRCTTASGRTGEPVPPTILGGARMNRNSFTSASASTERFMTSMM